MATKHNSKCLQNAGDDEEIFVLRAQDIQAPATIRAWIALNRNNGYISRAKLDEAEAVAQRMEKFQGRKLAD